MLEFYVIMGSIGMVAFLAAIFVFSLPQRPENTLKAKTPAKESSTRSVVIAYVAIFLFLLPLAIHRYITGDTEDKVLVVIIMTGMAIFKANLIRIEIRRRKRQ